MNTPFTREQATEICEDFEDLVDTELIIDTIKCYVDHVTMAPAAAADKETFINAYRTTHEVSKALSAYAGDEYDVLILASEIANEQHIIAQDIRTYIINNGVGYNFPD